MRPLLRNFQKAACMRQNCLHTVSTFLLQRMSIYARRVPRRGGCQVQRRARWPPDVCPACAAAGRIFEFVHGSGAQPPVITSANLAPIVEALLQSIKDEHHIAEKARPSAS